MSDRRDEIIAETISLFSREEDRKYLSEFLQSYRDRILPVKKEIPEKSPGAGKNSSGNAQKDFDQFEKDVIGKKGEKARDSGERYLLFMAPSLYSIRNAEDFYREIASLSFVPKEIEKDGYWILAEISFSESESDDFSGVLRLHSSDGTIWFKPPIEDEFQVAVNFADMLDQSKASFVDDDFTDYELDSFPFTDEGKDLVQRCFCHEDLQKLAPYYFAKYRYGGDQIFLIPQETEEARVKEVNDYFHYYDLVLELPPRRLDDYCRTGPGTEGDWYQFGVVYRRGYESACHRSFLVDITTGRFAIMWYCKTNFTVSYFRECLNNFLPGLIPPGEMFFSHLGNLGDLFRALDQRPWLDPVPLESKRIPVLEKPVFRKRSLISYVMGSCLMMFVFLFFILLAEGLCRGFDYRASEFETNIYLLAGLVLGGIFMGQFYLRRVKKYIVIQPAKNILKYSEATGE